MGVQRSSSHLLSVLLLCLHLLSITRSHPLRTASKQKRASRISNTLTALIFPNTLSTAPKKTAITLSLLETSPKLTATSSLLETAPKLTAAAFQKVMNAGGGSVQPGTEGFDPYSATMEPNDKCRTEANKYRTQCLFGHAFNNDKPKE